MLMPKKAVPSGLPRRRSVSACRVSPSSVVFSRKSCVMAMPIEANASDVRSHARNVRSAREKKRPRSASQPESKKKSHHRGRQTTASAYLAPSGPARRCPCSRARCSGSSATSASTATPPAGPGAASPARSRRRRCPSATAAALASAQSSCAARGRSAPCSGNSGSAAVAADRSLGHVRRRLLRGARPSWCGGRFLCAVRGGPRARVVAWG